MLLANPQFIEWACLQTNQEVIKRLEAEHIRADEGTDADGNTLLHKACEVGNISLVSLLHETYPQMDCSRNNSSGMQPLHVACAKGMLHVVMYLINNRMVDSSACTTDGRSALHIAAASNHHSLVTYLLSEMPPASFSLSESRGFTALHLACMEGHTNVVQALIGTRGMNISQLDRLGRNCMDMAIILGHLPVLRLLFSLPANIRPDVNAAHGVHNYTGLHWACANLQYAVIKYLVQDVGVDVEAEDTSGLTPDQVVNDPIVTMLVTGSVTDEEMLVAENAIRQYKPVEGENGDKHTKGKVVAGKSGGGGKKIEEEEESSDGEEEEEEESEDEADEDSASKEDDDEEESDSEEEEEEVASEKSGVASASASVSDSDSDSELFKLVKDEDNLERLEQELGATPNIKRDVRSIRNPKTGETLLHEASKQPYLSTIQFLVEGVGSDVDAVDKEGRTSLHYAAAASRLLVVRYLVKHAGAVLDVKDRKGKTALDLCTGSGVDAEEVKKTISKSLGKAPAKRRKVEIPVFGKK
jgi:ankyrin repeat protein